VCVEVVDVDVEVEVVVEVELEVELELELELDVVVLVVDVVLGDVDVVVVDAGAHESDTAWAPAGSPGIDASGVFAGTLTGSVTVWPVIRTTVTVHVSAEATGISARACTANTMPTVANATVSFRLLNTLD
jgi:hypothetical protein